MTRGPRPLALRTSLVVDEELVEIRSMERTHPMRKNPIGGPDRICSTSAVKFVRSTNLDPATLGEPPERTGQDETWSGDGIVFSQHKVRGQIVRGPAVEQGGHRWAELEEQIAELTALLRIQRNTSHAGKFYGP